MNRSLFFLLCLLPNLILAGQISLKVGDRTITMDVISGQASDNNNDIAWVVHNPDQTDVNTSLPFEKFVKHPLMGYLKAFFAFYGDAPFLIEIIGGKHSVFIEQEPEVIDGEEFVVESPLHRCFLIFKNPHHKNTYSLKELSFLKGQEVVRSYYDSRNSTSEKDVYCVQTADQENSENHFKIICLQNGQVLVEKKEGEKCVAHHYYS